VRLADRPQEAIDVAPAAQDDRLWRDRRIAELCE
jgi:hypothetical protein